MTTFYLVCGNDPLCRRDQSDLKRRGFYNAIPRFWHGMKAVITNIRVSQTHWKGNHWWDIWVDADSEDMRTETLSLYTPGYVACHLGYVTPEEGWKGGIGTMRTDRHHLDILREESPDYVARLGRFHRTISSISPILDPGEPPYREWWTLEGVTVEDLLSATEPDPAWTFTFSIDGYGEKRKG